jgi:exopolysaccharide/PEP-CTERM locus tyrosine autokinase
VGKIFDALEKSKKKEDTSDTKIDRSDSIVSEQNDSNKAPSEKVLSLKNKSTTFSHQTLEEAENDKNEGQVMPVDKTIISYNDNNIDKKLVALLQPLSFEAEQFKMLRTNLLFPVSGKSPRSIMVTSSIPDEGKSFVAANLAISIAQGIQEHVLLIDCDIRLPSIHTQFGFGDVPGLSEYLSNGTPVSSLILKTKVDKLSIFPGGKPPHNPSELLSSQQMSNLLKEARDRYSDRFIVIDSPPPTLTAETSAISRQVDGVLVVVEYGKTPRKMVSDLVEIVGRKKVLGIILNKFDIQFSSYHGIKKYKKYSKYYGT